MDRPKSNVDVQSKKVDIETKTKIDSLKECIFVQENQEALRLIREIDAKSLENYRDKTEADTKGMSLLHYAAAYAFSPDIIEELVNKCPKLLKASRGGDYEGLTVLHMLVSKKNVQAVKLVMEKAEKEVQKILLTTPSKGSQFEGTVMMGELPLIIAALTFEKEMVDLLLRTYKAKVHHTNSAGDSVFHALIRYSHLYPEKEEQAVDMMKYFHHYLLYDIDADDGDDLARQTWMMQNNTGFTALKMAALFSQSRAFSYIFQLKGVYCHMGGHDGLFDHLLYDITEIDPAAANHLTVQLEKEKKQKKNKVGPDDLPTPEEQKPVAKAAPEGVNKTSKTHKGSLLKRPDLNFKDRTLSVLEIVCETEEAEKTFEILNLYVLREVLAVGKWDKYKNWFRGWWAFHVAMMVCIIVLSVYKARLISYAANAGAASLVSEEDRRVEEHFVIGMTCVAVPFALFMLALEALRWQKRRQPFNLQLPHHNGLYRILLLVLAIGIIIDSIWNWVCIGTEGGPCNNYFLILAILAGCWFMSFFFRPFKRFSFFTVMIQRVLIGDMLRFFSVIALEYFSFSSAMYITFLRSPELPPEQFKDFVRTAFTMFKLMLGLEELDILYEAHDPWLAILLFVLYVLLTYVLMLNALIALMSNTCAVVSQEKDRHWLLQRLSVMLFIEASLPSCCRHIAGERKNIIGIPRIYAQILSASEKNNRDEQAEKNELMAACAFHLGKRVIREDVERLSVTPFTTRKHKDLLKTFQNVIEMKRDGKESSDPEKGNASVAGEMKRERKRSSKEKKGKKKVSKHLNSSMPLPTDIERPVLRRTKSSEEFRPGRVAPRQPVLEVLNIDAVCPKCLPQSQ